MSRPARLALIVAGSVAGLLIVLVVAALVIVQTPWFKTKVRSRIVSTVEQSTGGRAQVGTFSLNLPRLHAQLDNVVIRGNEAPGQPPLLRTRSIAVTLNRAALLHGKVQVQSLVVQQPQVYVEVKPDGTTNIPSPPGTKPSTGGTGKSPLQTVVDLAVGHVEVNNGLLVFADKRTPIDFRGEHLRVRFNYDAAVPQYAGTISMDPAWVGANGGQPLPVNFKATLNIARNRIELVRADLNAPQSHVALAGAVTNFTPLQGNLKLDAVLAPGELARTANVQLAANYRQAPPVDITTAVALDGNRLDVRALRVDAAGSSLSASGAIANLKNLQGSIHLQGTFSLAQLARLVPLPPHTRGTVKLNGEVQLAGASNYSVNARVDASDVSLQLAGAELRNVNASTTVKANPQVVALNNLRVAALGGTFDGNAELVEKTRFRVDGTLHRFDIRYLARRYAARNLVWDGLISGPVHAAGSLRGAVARQLVANANLSIVPGQHGIPLAGRIDVAYNGPRDTIDLARSYIALPHTRLDLSGTIGNQLDIRLASTRLTDLLPAIALASSSPPQSLPVALVNGSAVFDGTVTGRLASPRIAGHLALTSFAVHNETFDQFAADLTAQKSGAALRSGVLSRGPMQVRFDASVGLNNWKPAPVEPVSAGLHLSNAKLADLLAIAGQTSAPVSGTLGAVAQVSGTIGDPRATLDLKVTDGTLEQQPFSRLVAHVDYSNQLIALRPVQLDAGPARLDLNATYEHTPNQLTNGRLQFQIASNTFPLGGLRAIQVREPGLTGTFQLRAEGGATLQPGPHFQLTTLSANIAARTLALNQRPLGDLTATAQTSGSDLTFQLASNLANSNISGNGTVALAGNYPLQAQLTFSPVNIAAIRSLVSPGSAAGPTQIGGVISGGITVSGPAATPADMTGALRLDQLELTGTSRAAGGPARRLVTLHNAGPVVVTLAQSVVRIQSAHIVGTSTDLSLTGTMNLKNNNTLDVHVGGDIGLVLVESFVPNSFASGNILLNAAVQGQLSKPEVNGRLDLRNASFNTTSVSNGLVNANGTILFNRNEAVIQNISGETGGGKVLLAGVFRYGATPMAFDLRATAERVNVRTQQGISAQMDAKIALGGTTNNSLVGGTVTVDQVAFHSHTDFGSILSGAGAPPQAPQAQTGILGGMRFDITIETSPGIQFVTPLTQNLQANARVRLRGTPSSPGMTGHVAITQGNIVFFGSKYTINRGTINFFDPNRINPVLDIALQTKVQGIQVVLAVDGPMNNLKLTYRSDPPLEFSDIVRLLATGKVPTTDPVLAANQPVEPQQSWQQMGASALLGQAVANPVAGRLQRLFGVTQLKIEPKIVGVENRPEARMTLQQQITKDLAFTYIQDVTQPNPQIIRVEWAFQPAWSVVAVRDQYGQFGLDFFYRKRFR